MAQNIVQKRHRVKSNISNVYPDDHGISFKVKIIEGKEFKSNNPWINRNISFINGVPFVAYGFWFGGVMLGERKKVYDQLIANIGPPFYLITVANVSDFESLDHPFNPLVKYTLKNKKGLSGNHLSDYFRNYISYHYGGAYHDIKIRLKHQSISKYWKIFEDPNIWVVGMPNLLGGAGDDEIFEHILKNEGDNTDLVLFKNGKWNEENMVDSKLICNGGWIARPKTKLFEKINSFIEIRLNSASEMIKKHQVPNFSRCCPKKEVLGYPISWTALQGKIFHPYQLVYFSHIDRSMIRYETALYRHNSEDT